MSGVKKSLLDAIGKTPIVEISPKLNGSSARVLAKVEFFNPGGSVKDRAALAMVDKAQNDGILSPGATIVEPTSGNTGVGLALVCALRGYHLVLTMPETMSIERRKLAAAYGAEIVLTPGEDGMRGAISKAKEICELRGAIMLQQFENMANPQAHYASTGPEIWDQVSGDIDAFVCVVGTGGTFSGVGRYLKERNGQIRLIAVEPEKSAVLSGGTPGVHAIQGIGAGFVPATLDVALIDEVVKISDEEALSMAKRAAICDGLFVGISSGAALAAALGVAKRPEFAGKNIVTLLPDTGERYLSVW